jgi:class 3 adenylate cyclase/DNA-binding winged helix-turn-helix (wHTH) protein/tetratricopeptide (TPR) repeat protein
MPTLHFGPFHLDPTDDGLWRGSQRCHLKAKAVAVLRYLVEHPGRLVRKTDLLTAVWPNVHVSDWVLTTCIREIRHMLGDVATTPRYIETVHRQGYRFIAQVTVADVPAPLQAPEAPPLPSRPVLPTSEVPPSAPTPPILAEEYKLVTILCGTLVEAPALAARLGPERWYRWLQTMVGLAQEVLHHYDGTLMPPTSEGFTAVFGAPVAQEDHARRAVLAALELRQRLRTHHALRELSPGGDLAVRMGLHSGLVVVAELGQGPQRYATAVGAPVDLALRLQQQAAPGAILLSAATYALVHAEVRAAPGGTIDLAGSPAPMPVYTLQGLVGRHAGVAGRGSRAQSPFVGRERELALLHHRLATVRAGQGQVVGLVGEPGMGKTRLLHEFCRSLAGQVVTVYVGQCLSYGQVIPYLPVRDLLWQLCGLVEGEDATAHIAAVQRQVQESGLTAETDIALVLQLLDLPVAPACLAQLSPPARQARTFALLRHLVLHAAQRQPLVLVVENLHWSDATSASWLASLVERLADTAVLLLGTYRPGYQPPWLTRSIVTQMALPQLLPAESLTVVQSVLQTTTVSTPLLQTILTRAAGNPFFLEELTWAVLEEQRTHAAMPGIPETIQAVLAARIDRLPPAEKRLLQTAAVIGTEVAMPLLQTMAELPGEALHQALAHLQSADFLYEARLFPEPVYTFKHALTHEVAYGSLLHERRRVLHTRAVEGIETQYPERLVEQVEHLAHHALGGEVWDKALIYCRQAGEKAMARSAHREAAGYFEQALAALEHLPDSQTATAQAIDLRLGLRAALSILGDAPGLMLDHLHRAETLAQALEDHLRLGRIYAEMVGTYWVAGDADRAIVYGQRALALAAALGHGGLQAWAHLSLGQVYYDIGDYPRAVASLQRNVTTPQGELHYERFGAIGSVSATSRAWLSFCHAECGAFTEGLAIAEEGLRIAEAVQDPFSQIEACYGVSVVYRRQGDMLRAIPMLERAVGLCQEWHILLFLPRYTAALGLTYALAGRVVAGLALVEQGMEQAVTRGRPRGLTLVGTWLSEAYLLAGRLEEARQCAVQALDLARQHQQRGIQAWALWLQGESIARQAFPEIEPAASYYHQALALADELGMRPLQAHCHVGLGMLYVKSWQWEQARTALSTAIDLYRTMEMIFWLPRAEAALAKIP